MLVSMVVLVMLLGLSAMAYRFYAGHWEGRLADFGDRQAEARRLDLLLQAVQYAVPYAVLDNDGGRGFYFLGRAEGATFVTLAPIFAPREAALVRVFREVEQEGPVRLVYEEAPLEDIELASFDQRVPFRHRLVIIDDLASLDFRFLRPAEIGDFDERVPEQWVHTLDGRRGDPQPRALALRGDDWQVRVTLPHRGRQPLALGITE